MDQNVTREFWESTKPLMGEEGFDMFWSWLKMVWRDCPQYCWLWLNGERISKVMGSHPGWQRDTKSIFQNSWLKSMPQSKGHAIGCYDPKSEVTTLRTFDLFANDLRSSTTEVRLNHSEGFIPAEEDWSCAYSSHRRCGVGLCVSPSCPTLITDNITNAFDV